MENTAGSRYRLLLLQYQNLGAFLAQSAKNRAFRYNLLAAPKGFPLQCARRRSLSDRYGL
jgi:hypothetical protein